MRTEQGLQGGAALLQSVSRVGGGEEDGSGEAGTSRVQFEAHSGQQSLPARDAPHLVLHALLGRVHGVALPVLDALKRFFHLGERSGVWWSVSGDKTAVSDSFLGFERFQTPLLKVVL